MHSICLYYSQVYVWLLPHFVSISVKSFLIIQSKYNLSSMTFYIPPPDFWASLVAQMVKRLPTMRETRVNPWVGKISWRRKWQPTPVFLPGKSHGWRNLVGYSPWGPKELDMTEQLHTWLLLLLTQYIFFLVCLLSLELNSRRREIFVCFVTATFLSHKKSIWYSRWSINTTNR